MARLVDQSYELTDVSALKPHPGNARKHADAALDQSIASNGFYGAVCAQRSSGHILAGHARWERAQAAGLREVPVLWLDIDDAAALKILAGDNRVTDLAAQLGYDEEKLAALLTEVRAQSGSFEGTGYTEEQFDDLLKSMGDAVLGGESEDAPRQPDTPEQAAADEQTPEPEVLVISQPGDLWVLGQHRLLCGDSTDVGQVARLMDGGKADMVFTDPPYNVNYDPEERNPHDNSAERTARPLGKILNDHKTPEAFRAFLDAVYTALDSAIAPGRAIYICHADTQAHHFRNAFVAQPWKLQSCLIWKKSAMVFGRSDYHWMHEPILYGWKEGAPHVWTGDRKQTTILEVPTDHMARGGDTGGKYVHPTQKPVALIERALLNSSNAGETVLDLFGGSGSTMIACEKDGRKSRLMELDPKYVDVILRRWQQYAGKQPTLDGDGRTFEEVGRARLDPPQ